MTGVLRTPAAAFFGEVAQTKARRSMQDRLTCSFGSVHCDVHMNRQNSFLSLSSSPSPLGGPGLSRNEGPVGHWPGEGPGRFLERPTHHFPRLAGQCCHHHCPGSPEGEHECHADTVAGPSRILRVGQGFASCTPSSCRPISAQALAPLPAGVGVLCSCLWSCLLAILGAYEAVQRAREFLS